MRCADSFAAEGEDSQDSTMVGRKSTSSPYESNKQTSAARFLLDDIADRGKPYGAIGSSRFAEQSLGADQHV